MAAFEKGKTYTRAEVADMIDLPPERRSGGNWTTGYDSWNGEVFVFCNVGAAGRTGHNYKNKWIGDQLEWYGKTNSGKGHPSIQKMTVGSTPVHVFWRRSDKDRFHYAGSGRPSEVVDEVPVRIRWRFD